MDSEFAPHPARMTPGSAGYDFYLPVDLDMVPGEEYTVDTGVRLTDSDFATLGGTLVRQWFMMLVPRSGLGTRYGLRLVNTVGIVDCDYRDSIKATLRVDAPLKLSAGSRFMQGIIMPYLVLIGEREPSSERAGGHGSTGN